MFQTTNILKMSIGHIQTLGTLMKSLTMLCAIRPYESKGIQVA